MICGGIKKVRYAHVPTWPVERHNEIPRKQVFRIVWVHQCVCIWCSCVTHVLASRKQLEQFNDALVCWRPLLSQQRGTPRVTGIQASLIGLVIDDERGKVGESRTYQFQVLNEVGQNTAMFLYDEELNG